MSKSLFVLIFCLSLMAAMVLPAAAQTPTATPVPTGQATPEAPAQATPGAPLQPAAPGLNGPITSADAVTFQQVGQDEILLTGPYDTHTFLFGVPADWKPAGDAFLNLFMTVSFNTNVQNPVTNNLNMISGGVMQVRLNGVSLGILQLNRIGEVNERLTIPERALKSRRSDGRMEMNFILDSGLTCTVNQQMNVIIHPSSQFILPHETVTPDTSLTNFPYPLYQDSIYPDTAVIVIPDDPSAAELQAAMTLAAGLGNLTSSALTTTLTTASQLTPDVLANQHIILVGKAGSLPMLSQLTLPLGVTVDASGGQFVIDGGGTDDGVIQMINSPNNSSRVVMVVSGNTDAGVVKAAQAISTGLLRPNRAPNLAIVDQVQSTPVPVDSPLDQNLGDLGIR
jgi:cellulose synthase operon protein B